MMYITVALQAKTRYNDEEVINMNKEYLDLIYENEGEEVVEDATVFNDEWADINEEAWEL